MNEVEEKLTGMYVERERQREREREQELLRRGSKRDLGTVKVESGNCV